MGRDRLEEHLQNIQSALGGSGTPTVEDKLDWYLSNITSLITGSGGVGVDYQVCPDGLPQTGEKGIIYLVPSTSSRTKNVYDEYIWVDNEFECIGSTKADLTGYEETSNKVTSLSDQSTDTQYPSAKLVYDQLATKQATLVNQENIKSINGATLLGSGNIDIVSKHTFPNTWTTNGTTEAFCTSIVNDNSAVPGMIYMGKLTCSDLPGGLIQGEATVEIISKDANGKAIRITLTSVDTAPYRWEYERAKINGTYRNTGWVSYLPTSGGTMTNNINFPNGKGIKSSDEFILSGNSNGTAIILGNTGISNAIIATAASTNVTHNKGGSNVVNMLDADNTSANPTLTGTESALTALKLNDTSYGVKEYKGSFTSGTTIDSTSTATLLANIRYAVNNRFDIILEDNNTYTCSNVDSTSDLELTYTCTLDDSLKNVKITAVASPESYTISAITTIPFGEYYSYTPNEGGGSTVDFNGTYETESNEYGTSVVFGLSPTTIVANPTLVGTEDPLTSLQVGDTKYGLPYLPLAGGTLTGNITTPVGFTITAGNNLETLRSTATSITVGNRNRELYIYSNQNNIHHLRQNDEYIVLDTYNTSANPTLAGTESTLSGLKVNGTSYKLDYLPLSGGTMTGNLKFSGWTTGIVSPTGDRKILTAETDGSGIYLGHGITTVASIRLVKGTEGHVYVQKGNNGSNYEVLDADNTAANPTLAGTEATLTGIKVNGTSYKVNSGTQVTFVDWS